MKTTAICFLLLSVVLVATAKAEVTFDWATVGNPGNGSDDTGYGAVPYVYRISKYEVTNAQYTMFLNAVDRTGTNALALYHPSMSSNAVGGINFNSSAANGSKYSTKSNMRNKPVIHVSFFDAMRFTNWLQNGQGTGSTESGAYTISDGVSEVRDPSAIYFIPNEDEWYKAAYHKNDGVTTNYWDYPTSTDVVPYSDQPPGTQGSGNAPTQSNTENCRNDDGIANGYDDGFAVTGSTTFSNLQNYLTNVGAYTSSVSPYGTFDQGGNVSEYNEAVLGSTFRGVRGGNWNVSSLVMAASDRGSVQPTFQRFTRGFRVASIPEPSSLVLGLLGVLGVLGRRRRSG